MSRPIAREVPCPRCTGPSLFSPDNRWRPFCSERCASIDLGAWASEAYRVPAAPSDDATDAPPGAGDPNEPPLKARGPLL